MRQIRYDTLTNHISFHPTAEVRNMLNNQITMLTAWLHCFITLISSYFIVYINSVTWEEAEHIFFHFSIPLSLPLRINMEYFHRWKHRFHHQFYDLLLTSQTLISSLTHLPIFLWKRFFWVREIYEQFKGKKLILGVDDMDVIKGISLKLLIVDQLL